MAVYQTQRYCSNCEHKTLHARQTFGAGWGCFLSIITLGLFIPVWLIIGVFEAFRPWRCQMCGKGKML